MDGLVKFSDKYYASNIIKDDKRFTLTVRRLERGKWQLSVIAWGTGPRPSRAVIRQLERFILPAVQHSTWLISQAKKRLTAMSR